MSVALNVINIIVSLSQIHSWHFDVFALNKSTGGNPLITVTIALLEVYGLLVRPIDYIKYLQCILSMQARRQDGAAGLECMGEMSNIP